MSITSILTAIFALSFLILVHEIGHFTACKLLGVRVLEFAVFMGPKLFSVKKGDTVYSLRLIPIGGFVKMEGEEEESEDEKSFTRKPKWVRAVVLFAGSFVNLLVAFIMMLIICVNRGFSTNELNVVLPESPIAVAGLQSGDWIYSYNGRRVNTPTDIYVYMIDTRGAEVKIKYRRNGQLMETMFRPEYFQSNYYAMGFNGEVAYGPDWNVVKTLREDGPAAMTGILVGDRIISINGAEVANREELREALAAGGGGEVDVTILRDGESIGMKLTPVRNNSEEFFEMGGNFTYIDNPDIGEGSLYAVHESLSGSRLVLFSLKWLFTGQVSLSQASGPVGIVVAIGDTVEMSEGDTRTALFDLMNLVALIGINLGLFNLIPFPALDGSKLTLLLIEAIRGRRIPVEKEAAISLFGFVILIMLMVFTFYNDILRLMNR